MTRLHVVMEETGECGQLNQWIIGAHLSRHGALEFVKNHGVGGRHLYIVETAVVDNEGDTNENTFLRLQRSLSRVERRLGKTRQALRLANERLKIYRDHFNSETGVVDLDAAFEDTVVMADPVFQASWAEPEHADD